MTQKITGFTGKFTGDARGTMSATAHDPASFSHRELQVLHQDNHTIVVFKPARIPVQSDSSGDISLLEVVRQYIAAEYQKPGNVFVGMVQRLDRPVSGLVVFARTSKGAARLSEQLRQHRIHKHYLALVHGAPSESEGTLRHLLEYREGTAIAGRHGQGKTAVLHYRVLQHLPDTSLLHIRLETGRKHQIRFQLSRIGCPILGDLRYGARAPLPDQSIALCAWALSYEHPTSRQLIMVRLPAGLLPQAIQPLAEILPDPFTKETLHEV